ncbi:Rhodanese-like domain-containing protein [Giardia muris]|uniref:Rhodanese-like domain-containing protein n=1 Tax=Giardia muris TaxID=5742 RepID=A0A4Z1ST06_GIAMU|nr:Rhodanese-like domain-containing protein [Giardia muris]|eukprot:TNJ28890.1 Rhodanese-like domain-containing protein [Giardia muris]
MNPMLVSQQWLLDETERRRIHVFCCRDPTDASLAYEQGEFSIEHIPASLPLITTPETLMKADHIPTTAEFSRWAGLQGLISTENIVLYAQNSSNLHIYASWWYLQYFQIRRVALLMGGFHKWKGLNQPIESGPARSVRRFRELGLRPDRFLFFRRKDMELFLLSSTGTREPKAYEQKPFIYKQIVYVGTQHSPELGNFFLRLSQCFQEQAVKLKLDLLRQKATLESMQRKQKDRAIYHSIIDTTPFEHVRTLKEIGTIRTTAPTSTSALDPLTAGSQTAQSFIYRLPYTLFLTQTGTIFDGCDEETATKALSEASMAFTTSTVADSLAHTHTAFNYSASSENDMSLCSSLVTRVFSNAHINVDLPTLFMGDSLAETALVIFAATLARGTGTFLYSLHIIDEALVRKIANMMHNTLSTDLVKALDDKLVTFSKYAQDTHGRSGTSRADKKALYVAAMEDGPLSNGSKEGLVRQYRSALPQIPQYHTLMETQKTQAIRKLHTSIFMFDASVPFKACSKESLLKDMTDSISRFRTTNLGSNSDPLSALLEGREYEREYSHSNKQILSLGFHPSGRELTNTERLKLSINLPILSATREEPDYTDPATISHILQNYVSGDRHQTSALPGKPSHITTAKALASKFLAAFERISQRYKSFNICSGSSWHVNLATPDDRKDRALEGLQKRQKESLEETRQLNETRRFISKSKGQLLVPGAEQKYQMRPTTLNKKTISDPSAGLVGTRTLQRAPPTSQTATVSLQYTRSSYSKLTPVLTEEQKWREQLSAMYRDSLIRELDVASESGDGDQEASLDELDDYFELLADKALLSFTDNQDTETYALRYRQCLSELIIVSPVDSERDDEEGVNSVEGQPEHGHKVQEYLRKMTQTQVHAPMACLPTLTTPDVSLISTVKPEPESYRGAPVERQLTSLHRRRIRKRRHATLHKAVHASQPALTEQSEDSQICTPQCSAPVSLVGPRHVRIDGRQISHCPRTRAKREMAGDQWVTYKEFQLMQRLSSPATIAPAQSEELTIDPSKLTDLFDTGGVQLYFDWTGVPHLHRVHTSTLRALLKTPAVRFCIKKYGSQYFSARTHYPVLTANTMEFTFRMLETLILRRFRSRLVALTPPPIGPRSSRNTTRYGSQLFGIGQVQSCWKILRRAMAHTLTE